MRRGSLLRDESTQRRPAMTEARQKMGRLAEGLVAERLRAGGWAILERNARTRSGEIDIVALDRDVLVFVEVKAGRAGARAGPERPVLAIGPRKQRRLRRLAAAWLSANRPPVRVERLRFDAVGVTFAADGSLAAYEHIRAAW
jgi:putative endonuclease